MLPKSPFNLKIKNKSNQKPPNKDQIPPPSIMIKSKMVQIDKNDADKITTIYKKNSQSVGSSPTLSSFTCLGGIYI